MGPSLEQTWEEGGSWQYMLRCLAAGMDIESEVATSCRQAGFPVEAQGNQTTHKT